jgi:hypothetical protein
MRTARNRLNIRHKYRGTMIFCHVHLVRTRSLGVFFKLCAQFFDDAQRWGNMFDIQSNSDVTDQMHTFDVPIKLTRAQLEKMLRAVEADVDDVNVPPNPTETCNALTAMAVKKAKELIDITKRRSRLVSVANLFADPAWFILLDLFVRQHSGLQTSVSSACHASFSPVTTALRHIAILTERKIIEREYDPVDQRRVFLRLTDDAVAEIQRTLLTDDFKDMAIAS